MRAQNVPVSTLAGGICIKTTIHHTSPPPFAWANFLSLANGFKTSSNTKTGCFEGTQEGIARGLGHWRDCPLIVFSAAVAPSVPLSVAPAHRVGSRGLGEGGLERGFPTPPYQNEN